MVGGMEVAPALGLEDTHDVVLRDGCVHQVRSRSTGRALRVSHRGKVILWRPDGTRAWVPLSELQPARARARTRTRTDADPDPDPEPDAEPARTSCAGAALLLALMLLALPLAAGAVAAAAAAQWPSAAWPI
jgi:hypothetical protein